MIAYSLPTGPYQYRALKEGLQGWDVYALQTGLNEFGDLQLVEDGVFGADTKTKVIRYQRNRGLLDDGIAGIVTQRAVALEIAEKTKVQFGLPVNLLKGQLEHESGFQLGNHTAVYPANGSRDLGVAQRNDRFTSWFSAFDVHQSIDTLGSRIRTKYAEYKNLKKVSNARCWELAAGSWNAPAWTDKLARGEKLSPAQTEWIEGYIDRVTVYVTSWPSS